MPADTARDCTVTMLDGTSFNVSIKPKLLASELVEMACSHCKINVEERKYFGLKISHGSYDCWLEPEKPVLDPSHDLPKPPQPLILNLAILFYVEDYRLLTDHIMVEQYYFQAKQGICFDKLECENHQLFTLIGCILQEMCGNYRNDREAIENLKALMTLPKKVIMELGIVTCEKEVLHYYRNLRGHSRGDAIVRFLETVQSLPMYGVHYFSVKDKKECPKWLGIGLEGVMQFNHEDKQSCTRRWSWKQLKNIVYKDNKFIMDIIDNNNNNNNSHSQLKHTISSPGVTVDHTKKPQPVTCGEVIITHTWYSTPKVVLSLSRMAKVQQKFSEGKSTSSDALDPAELIKRLNTLLVAPSNLRRSPSESQNSISSSGSSNPISAQAQEVAKSAQSHMYTALTGKRNALVEQLEAKVKRYKELQVKEMQITRIPPEGLSEDIISSLVNKGPNQFKFSPLVLENGHLGSEILQLEKQIEVQSAIVKANKRLVSESTDGRLKKARKKDLKKQEEKLKDLEDQSSRHDYPMPRQNHLITRQELTSRQVPRQDPFLSRQQQDFGGHHHLQEHHRTPPMPTCSLSNMSPHQQQRYYPDDQLGFDYLKNSEPGSSSTLERRRRKFSQPDSTHASLMGNGYSPGRQPKPVMEQDLFSYHNSNNTLTRPNTNRYDPGRYDQVNYEFAPSSLPYGMMQHPRQRSEPEYLFEHAKSDIVDYQHHRVNNSITTNNKYHEQNSYNFHDPGTFEEGTLV